MRFSESRVAKPVVAEEVATCRRPKRHRRNDWHRAVGPKARLQPLRPFSCSARPENHGPRCVRERTQRWDVPLLENVLLTPRSCVGTFSRVAILGKRASEKRATATKKAVETLGGGRDRPRNTGATRHRRAASRSGGATSAERDGRPVSDEMGVRDSVGKALRREGYQVVTYADGQEAWQSFEYHLPDLAVLDILMPRLDGLELCRRLRTASDTLPIIFLTSKDEEFDRVLGLELGADDYLCKPFSMRELTARVKVLFRRLALVRAGNTATVEEDHDHPRPSLHGPAALPGQMEG
jgi:CheY-like chemotaxis protein